MAKQAPDSEYRVIKIATQRPTLFFGGGHPMDTINKHLARSYSIGTASTGYVAKWVAATVAISTALFVVSFKYMGEHPRTMSKEWQEATRLRRLEEGSDIYFMRGWTPGQPIPLPKTSPWDVD